MGLLVLAVAMVTGLGLAAACGLRFRSMAGALGTAFLAGFGAQTLAIGAARAAGVGADLAVCGAVTAAGLALALLLRKRLRIERAAVSPLAAAALALSAALVLVDALGEMEFQNDSARIWLARARVLLFDSGFSNADEARRQGLAHAEYPPLVPLAQLLLFRCGGAIDLFAVRILHFAFYAALLAVFVEAAGSTTLAAWAAVPLALCPRLAQMAPWGMADVPLAGFALAAALQTGRARSTGEWCFASLLLACTAWTKNEGAILAALAVAIGFLRREIPLRRLAILLPAAIPVIAWKLFASRQGWKVADFELSPPPLVLERTVAIAGACGEWLVDPESALLPLASLLLLARRGAGSSGLAALGLVYGSVMTLAYHFTTWPIREHLETSYVRVMLHAFILLWAAAIAEADRIPPPSTA